MAINQIMATVSLIVQMQGAQPIGTATGFFYEDGQNLYLVTNLHVVKGSGVAPDKLRLKLHTDATDISKNDNYDIELFDSKKTPVWKSDAASPEADVAVLKLDRAAVLAKFVVKAWSKANFLPSKYTMEPGEDVFIIGYPLGVSDDFHNLPVLRGGMVASAYGVPFKNSPLFLTDINLHPGTSGSPVISKPKPTWVNQETGGTELNTGTTYYLLGVHSGTLNIKNPQDGLAIGLGAAWYANLVQTIVEQF
jgi:S1-C subfamily serine protease